MNETQDLIDRVNQFLATQLEPLKQHKTGRLLAAMEYTLLNGGKRMRPLLVYATAESTGLDLNVADHIAAAIEMIHAYSLIHDDLPAMDDDDLRRGQPTCHVQYDEATAILAADALQALAFSCLTETPVKAEVTVKLVKNLSHAAGTLGMVGGQMLDLEAENQTLSFDELQNIHTKKTGALLKACITMVTDCSKTISDSQRQSYADLATNFGILYQIIDDILDVTSDTQTLGKPAQSDIKNQKSTYPSLLGLEKAKAIVNRHIKAAKAQLSNLPANTHLKKLLDVIANRTF